MADGYTGVHTRRAFAARASMLAAVKAAEAASSRIRAVADIADEGPHAPAGLVNGLRAFAAGHGGATAVIEYVGRKGARIVLTGGDGARAADHYAESTEAARIACAQAGVDIEHEWERELTEQMQVTTDLWAGRRRVLSR
jgi:hypothetical protein